ncbi:MAG: hypothetical protein EBT34_10055 [Acetobacteraceae bacterium]|nr:hypothetical protein [Acetobacteraceae bacterium]
MRPAIRFLLPVASFVADRDRSALRRRRAPPRAWLRCISSGAHSGAHPPAAAARGPIFCGNRFPHQGRQVR